MYAEIDTDLEAAALSRPGEAEPHRPSKRARRMPVASSSRAATATLDGLAERMQRDEHFRPAFSGFNVIAVRRSLLDRLVDRRAELLSLIHI